MDKHRSEIHLLFQIQIFLLTLHPIRRRDRRNIIRLIMNHITGFYNKKQHVTLYNEIKNRYKYFIFIQMETRRFNSIKQAYVNGKALTNDKVDINSIISSIRSKSIY